MRTPADAREWAKGQWKRNWRAWLADLDCESRGWPLHRPTEAEVAADPDAVAAWVRSWRGIQVPGLEVTWVERRWPVFGRQRVPERISATPSAIAELAGRREQWRHATAAADRVRQLWPSADLAEAVVAAAPALSALAPRQVEQLVAVLEWVASHPSEVVWERELPVAGIDTKWWERNRSLVEPFAAVLARSEGGVPLRGEVQFLVHLLDDELSPGPRQFSTGLAGLHQMRISPAVVLLCENRTTVATLPALPGVVAVHSMGLSAPLLAEVDWIAGAPVIYWGDLDSHGFRLLGNLRRRLPEVQSVLMDALTLETHLVLAEREPQPFRGEIGYLTVRERDVLAVLRKNDLRLEQERIGRDYAREALDEVVTTAIRRTSDPRRV